MFTSLLLLFLAAAVAPLVERLFGRKAGWILASAPASVFVWFLAQDVSGSAGPAVETLQWFPGLDVNLTFALDGLGKLMALLITGIGTLILIYARSYLHGAIFNGRFLAYLTGFLASMLGVVLSDNLILLFVFWELTSVTSYLLIGYHHSEAESRWKALQALLLTGAGGVAMLAGLILMALVSGQWTISGLIQNPDLIRESAHLPVISFLILLGALTKSAQFPFHFWLPNAMAAPTPVSAFLHSATMVKAGVFLMARLTPVLGDSNLWNLTLTVCGAITLLYGAFEGLRQQDLKRILAYTTLSVLGMITFMLGLGSTEAVTAAIVFLFAHAIYKAALFMIAGNIDHGTGTRDVLRLCGLAGYLPITAFASVAASFSKAGFPPFFGFVAKESVYEATLHLPFFCETTTLVALVGNAMLMALAFKAGLHPFIGRFDPDTVHHRPHEAPPGMLVGPVILGVASLALGFFGYWIATPIVGPAVDAAVGEAVHFKVKLWHGWNAALLLSGVTFLAGALLFLFRQQIWAMSLPTNPGLNLFDRAWHRGMDGFLAACKALTSLFQSGSLHNYFFIVITFFLGLITFELASLDELPPMPPFGSVDHFDLVTLALITSGTLISAFTKSRVNALTGLGVVGFSVAAIFLRHGAPDLAITQIIVETLTVVLFMLVIAKLPPLRVLSSRRRRGLDLAVSIFGGVLITILVLKAQALNLEPSIAHAYGDLSYIDAKGRNVVNVILVDFRAMDTLGEITVLCIAGLGVLSLLTSRQSRKPSLHPNSH